MLLGRAVGPQQLLYWWSGRLRTCCSHKRYDPVYSSAHQQSKNIGDFSYWYSYMSQPKSQLQTFAAWAGIDSDISQYLNSHHVGASLSRMTFPALLTYEKNQKKIQKFEKQIDIHCWFMEGLFKPVKVTASASTGIATAEPYNCAPQTEDVITLLVEWESLTQPGRKGTAGTFRHQIVGGGIAHVQPIVYTASWTGESKG